MDKLKEMRYGEVVILNGRIEDNPLKQKRFRTQAVQWCLIPENKRKILNKLNYLQSISQDTRKLDLDLAYNYVINYFLSPNKVFYKDFSLTHDSNYTIDQYILSNIQNIFYIYKSELRNKNSFEEKTTPDIVYNSEGQELSLIENKVYEQKSIEDTLEMSEEYVNYFNKLIEKTKQYILLHNYNLEKFEQLTPILIDLFIQPLDYDKDKLASKVANKHNIPLKLIEIFMQDLKKDYKNKDKLADEIFNLLNKVIYLNISLDK